MTQSVRLKRWSSARFPVLVHWYAANFFRPLRSAHTFTQLLLFVGVLSLAQQSLAQTTTIVGFDVRSLPGGNNNFGPSPLTPTTTAANVTAVGLTRGTGVTTSGTAAARAWGGTGWTSASATDAIAAQKYVTFSVNANAGYTLSLSAIDPFNYRRSTAGAASALIQYQINSGAFVDITTVNFTNTNPTGANLGATSLSSIGALQNLPSTSTVTFRIVPYGGTNASGTWYIFDVAGSTADDFAVTGTVTASGGGPTTPTVSLAVNPSTGSEATSTVISVSAIASAAVTSDQTVSLAVTGTGITSGDYTLSSNTITIPSGSTYGTVTFTIVNDTDNEGTEVATLTISNPSSGITLGSPVSQNITIADDDAPATKISTIQGSGSTFAVGGTQTVEGIVTRTFLNSTALSGFYMQEEDADSDGNAATSEGIFVYDPAGRFTGNVGDKVRVTGTVGEYTSSSGGNNSSLTQLTNITSVINMGAATLPTVTNLQFPVSSVSDLERYEGMLVNASAASGNLTVTETYQLGQYGQLTLASTGPGDQLGTDPRFDQYTQFVTPTNAAAYSAYLADLAKRKIILDDGRASQNPDPIIFGRGGNPLSAANPLRGGDQVSSITAILDERFEGYRLQTLTGVNFMATNPRPSTPPALGGSLKVGSFNILNYFNGNGSGGGFPTSRGADTQAEFVRQRAKIVAAIVNSGVDILSLMELENDGFGATSAIQDLVNGINDATAPGTYTFVNPGTSTATDEITVGMLYKPAKVSVVGQAAVIPNGYGNSANSSSFDAVGRKPLAQTFREIATNGVFTVVANHFKSKGSPIAGDDADAGDGQGQSNGTRKRQAQDLAQWLATKPTGTNDPDYLLLGDFNAYAKEDPLTILAGSGYINLLPNTSYSYVFDGQVGALDHALGTASLQSQVAGAEKWHINADEPTVMDYNTEFKSGGQVNSLYSSEPFRASDHDPVIVGLSLAPSVAITSPSASSTVCAGTTVKFSVEATGASSYQWYKNGNQLANGGSISGATTATLTITNAQTGDAGSYSVVAIGTYSSVTSTAYNLTVNQQPTPTLTSSGPITNTNPTATLTATGGSTYTFSSSASQINGPSGNTASVTNPGVYSVTAIGAGGCSGIASTTVTGAASQSSCRNGSAVITVVASGNPVKYEWYRTSINSARLTENPAQVRGTSTASLTLINQQVTADYYVRVTDANGTAVVYGPFRMTVNLNCNIYGRVGAEESTLQVVLAPNPLRDNQLRAIIEGAEGQPLQVELRDLTGRPVRSQAWEQAGSRQEIDWNLSNESSGVYLLRAIGSPIGGNRAQAQTVKVIKP